MSNGAYYDLYTGYYTPPIGNHYHFVNTTNTNLPLYWPQTVTQQNTVITTLSDILRQEYLPSTEKLFQCETELGTAIFEEVSKKVDAEKGKMTLREIWEAEHDVATAQTS